MLRLFKERDEVRVVGDQCGSPTYAPDLAEVLIQIVRLNSDAYGIYNFTNEGKISWYDFACEIYRMAQEKKLLTKEVVIQRIVTADYPTKTQRPKNSYLSKDKIIKTFNISPRNWEAALNEFMLGKRGDTSRLISEAPPSPQNAKFKDLTPQKRRV
jgi:dTDP-4-dehydrorhamnose reductase